VGQKIHPYGFRVGITRPWISRWQVGKKDFGRNVVEDYEIRKYIRSRLYYAGIALVEIERTKDEVRILIHAARPGIVIGRKGTEIDSLKEDLQTRTGGKATINIQEITQPATSAQVVATGIAEQLVKRASHRRVMRKAIEAARAAGAKGVKIICKGRLGGAEIARRERYVDGALPLHTLRANIDYGFAEASTTYGQIGIKVWIYKGMIKEGEEKEISRAPDA